MNVEGVGGRDVKQQKAISCLKQHMHSAEGSNQNWNSSGFLGDIERANLEDSFGSIPSEARQALSVFETRSCFSRCVQHGHSKTGRRSPYSGGVC